MNSSIFNVGTVVFRESDDETKIAARSANKGKQEGHLG